MITVTMILFFITIFGWIIYVNVDQARYYREQEAKGDFSHNRPTRERKLVRGRTSY